MIKTQNQESAIKETLIKIYKDSSLFNKVIFLTTINVGLTAGAIVTDQELPYEVYLSSGILYAIIYSSKRKLVSDDYFEIKTNYKNYLNEIINLMKKNNLSTPFEIAGFYSQALKSGIFSAENSNIYRNLSQRDFWNPEIIGNNVQKANCFKSANAFLLADILRELGYTSTVVNATIKEEETFMHISNQKYLTTVIIDDGKIAFDPTEEKLALFTSKDTKHLITTDDIDIIDTYEYAGLERNKTYNAIRKVKVSYQSIEKLRQDYLKGLEKYKESNPNTLIKNM